MELTAEQLAALAQQVAQVMATVTTTAPTPTPTPAPTPAPAYVPPVATARPPFDNPYYAPTAPVDPATIAKQVAEMLAPQFKPQPNVADLIKEAFATRDAEAQRQAMLANVPSELHQLMPADNAKLSEFLGSEVYTKLAAPFQAAPATTAAPAATTADGTPAATTGDVSTTPNGDGTKTGTNYEEQRSELFKSFADIFEDA